MLNINWKERYEKIRNFGSHFGSELDDKFRTAFDELEKKLPDAGKCDTLGMEMVRAIQRVCYRNQNDGDLPMPTTVTGFYGLETANPSMAFWEFALEIYFDSNIADWSNEETNEYYSKVCDIVEEICRYEYEGFDGTEYDTTVCNRLCKACGWLMTYFPELLEIPNDDDSRDFISRVTCETWNLIRGFDRYFIPIYINKLGCSSLKFKLYYDFEDSNFRYYWDSDWDSNVDLTGITMGLAANGAYQVTFYKSKDVEGGDSTCSKNFYDVRELDDWFNRIEFGSKIMFDDNGNIELKDEEEG